MTVKKASVELVNSLAHSYLTLKAQIAALEAQLQPLRENLIGIALTDGSTPPRSEKTTRLETPSFEINVRQGHSVSVEQPNVEALRRWIDGLAIPYTGKRIFKKLFKEDARYTLRMTSEELERSDELNGLLNPKQQQILRDGFRQCIRVVPNRPALEVKEKTTEAKTS